MTDPEENTPSYAVRFAPRVGDFIVQEYERVADISGFGVAEQWRQSLLEALRGLATYPYRCVVAPETPIFQQVVPGQTLRQLVHRRTRTGPVWRILFSVHEADDRDPPTVRVRHILHGAQAPLTEWPHDED